MADQTAVVGVIAPAPDRVELACQDLEARIATSVRKGSGAVVISDAFARELICLLKGVL